MAAKYDVESLITDIQSVLSSNLNTKLSTIDTEKNDGMTLTTVASAAYFLDMDDKAANFNPIVLIGESENIGEGIGPATSEKVTIQVALILNDNGTDLNIVKRMLRYRRALKEVIEDNFYKNRRCDYLQVKSLPVLDFLRSGESLRYKIAGIEIIASIS